MYKYLQLFLFIIILASCDLSEGNNSTEQKFFDKINPGMTIKEVSQILGKPDYVVPSSDSGNYYYYFTKSKVRSEMPVVKFDSIGVVQYSGY